MSNKADQKIPFTIRVEPTLRKAFLVAAQQHDRSGSVLIRDFMRDFLKRHHEQSERQEPGKN
jgi:predicted transcriptional regulator